MKLSWLKSLHGVDMPPAAFRVLITLFDYSNAQGGNAFPGIERLAKDCAMSERTVKRQLKYLRESGLIVEKARGRRGQDGKGWASVYELANKVDHTSTQPAQSDVRPEPAQTSQSPQSAEEMDEYFDAVTRDEPCEDPDHEDWLLHDEVPCGTGDKLEPVRSEDESSTSLTPNVAEVIVLTAKQPECLRCGATKYNLQKGLCVGELGIPGCFGLYLAEHVASKFKLPVDDWLSVQAEVVA